MKHKPVTAAILTLLNVQSKLEVFADLDKPIDRATAKEMAEALEGARNTLQRSILEAGRILEEGA
jgi:hypothetical protein